MKITLHDGVRECSFNFEPEHLTWNRNNPPGEYLIGYETGLPEPFTKVFVKRVPGKPATAHNLLRKLEGQTILGMPKVLGYTHDQRSHIYFFQNLPASYKLLNKQLIDIHIICPEIVRSIIKQSAEVFKTIFQHGYVYIDFCAKNIMLDHTSNSIAIIDLDSSWPIKDLSKILQLSGDKSKIEFWGLWNWHVSNMMPNNLDAAPKTVVLSFTAVWSRAIMLAHRPTQSAHLDALKLVYNPSYKQQQLKLWNALAAQNRYDFLEYFGLSEANARTVYNQWQAMFSDLQRGRELPWQELISSTENLLIAIGEAQKPQTRQVRSASAATSGKAQTGTATTYLPPSKGVTPPQSAAAATTPTPSQTQSKHHRGQSQVELLLEGFSKSFFKGLRNPLSIFHPPDKLP